MRLVIFDVDGTLVDSQNDIVAALSIAFEQEHQTVPSRAQALSIVGLSLPEAMHVLAPHLNAGIRERLVEAYKSAYMQLRGQAGARQSSPLYPGIREILDDLAGRPDLLLGVATGKSRRGLDKLLDAHDLNGFFVTEQVADHHPSKPNPSMIDACLQDTGVARADAVMIGDTSFDMDMAQAAGIAGLGVLWGYHSRARLGAASALIERVDQIPVAVENVRSKATHE